MENKNQIRSNSLAKRNSMSAEERAEKSILAAKLITEWELFLNSKKIMIFSSFRSEIDTLPVITKILESGKELYIPVCIKSTSEIVAAKVTSLDSLSLNSYGILEPSKKTIFLGDSSELDMIIVPGAAFDLKGNRIGYGAGYYDRLLSRKGVKAISVGYCFDAQIVEQIPADIHDIPLQYIISDDNIYSIPT